MHTDIPYHTSTCSHTPTYTQTRTTSYTQIRMYVYTDKMFTLSNTLYFHYWSSLLNCSIHFIRHGIYVFVLPTLFTRIHVAPPNLVSSTTILLLGSVDICYAAHNCPQKFTAFFILLSV